MHGPDSRCDMRYFMHYGIHHLQDYEANHNDELYSVTVCIGKTRPNVYYNDCQ